MYQSHSRGPPIFPFPRYYYSEDTAKDEGKLLEGEMDLAHFCITLSLVHNRRPVTLACRIHPSGTGLSF